MGRDQLAATNLLWKIINGRTGDFTNVTYSPQKAVFPRNAKNKQPLPREIPETQGISSEQLMDFLTELSHNKMIDVHHVMVLRHGNVICESDFYPYQPGIWHATYSLCKSITGLAVGMLIAEGKLALSDTLAEIFKDRERFPIAIRQKKISIENLLTMTSGVDFHEAGVYTGDDWVKGFLGAQVKGKPGTTFDYNSLNSYMLSATISQITGQTMMDYLQPRLWEPLGITNVVWEHCPMGITEGGWGLFICPEDVAKIGQLILQKGAWHGKQIVPADWLDSMTQKQVDVPPEKGFGYGYHIWVADRPGSSTFNGMLGQNLIIYPDIDMAIVTNAGSNELFQQSTLIDIVRKYFGTGFTPTDVLPENRAAYMKLQEKISEIAEGRAKYATFSFQNLRRQTQETIESRVEQSYKKALDGLTYELDSVRVGLLPLLLQGMRNNFSYGIQTISFKRESRKFLVVFREGTDENVLPIGFGKPEITTISINDESFLVATSGVFSYDEDGYLVLKLDIAYLEEAARRKVKISFIEDEIITRWDETPGTNIILRGVQHILKDTTENFLFKELNKNVNPILITELIVSTTRPIITGKLSNTSEEKKSRSSIAKIDK